MGKRVGLSIAAILAILLAAGVPYVWSQGYFQSNRSDAATPTTSPSGRTPKHAARGAAPAPPALPPAFVHPAPVSIDSPGFWSWTVLDRRTGETAGSPNAAVANRTASMIKAWLASDYLRRAAERNATPSAATMQQLTIMIRNSDNAAASAMWEANGRFASITRLVTICGLTDSRAYIDWASTLVSARDAARMGACIGDGRAAGPKWTEWVLNEMRHVSATGRFGILPALPADVAPQTAIKNGWVARSDGKWHINCMAIGTDWVLAVMTVYPVSMGMTHGGDICASITRQLMA